jgi:hypothetical protein
LIFSISDMWDNEVLVRFIDYLGRFGQTPMESSPRKLAYKFLDFVSNLPHLRDGFSFGVR